jgi:Glycosyltransferase family 87
VTWARAFLPPAAIVVFSVTTLAILASAGSTLGYDYQAYVQAAQRLLDGQPLYDPAVDVAGGFAIFLYPPPYAIAFVPFALIGPAGMGLWTGLLIACIVAAIALMPTSATIRWAVLLLAGLDWPVVYSIKLGQVGPILLLLFVLGWRWLERPAALGTTIGLGALVKVQPFLLVGWAALARAWRAAAVAVAVVAVGCLVSLPFVGVGAWADYVALLRSVSEPVTTPHNFTVGAVLYQAGASASVANAIQWAGVVATLLAVVVGARRLTFAGGFVVAAVASQLVSPLLWDHYAVILLLPTALLLAHGARWAVAIPLATSVPLIWIVPAAVYPIVFWVALVAPFTIRDRSADAVPTIAPAAAA